MADSSNAARGARPMQVPPLDNGHAVILKFTQAVDGASEGRFAVLATGSDTIGAYEPETEYWFQKPVSLDGVSALVMEVKPGPFTPDGVGSELPHLTLVFSDPECVPSTSWVKGVCETSAGASAYLFRAPDPDQSGAHVGLLVQQNANHELVSTTWYKSSQPASGFVWQSSNMPTSSVTWTLVTNDKGDPSTDPAHIGSPGATWYFVSQS